MKSQTRAVAAAVALLAAAVAACVPAASVRRHTYPPDFRYVERTEVRTTMQRLARDVTRLEAVLRQPGGPPDEGGRGEVIALLDRMRTEADRLRLPGEVGNHPELGGRLDDFRRDLELALAGAEAVPPNYFHSGMVAGACLRCHATPGR
jgi:hypothetical protein